MTLKELNLSPNLHNYKHILSLNTLLYIIHRNITWCLCHFKALLSKILHIWTGWFFRTLPVIWMKWPYLFFPLHNSLCTILYLEYFQCNDVLKDFTMRWEINIFMNVRYSSRVLCLVNTFMYFNNTSTTNKLSEIEMLQVFKIEAQQCVSGSNRICVCAVRYQNWVLLNYCKVLNDVFPFAKDLRCSDSYVCGCVNCV